MPGGMSKHERGVMTHFEMQRALISDSGCLVDPRVFFHTNRERFCVLVRTSLGEVNQMSWGSTREAFGHSFSHTPRIVTPMGVVKEAR